MYSPGVLLLQESGIGGVELDEEAELEVVHGDLFEDGLLVVQPALKHGVKNLSAITLRKFTVTFTSTSNT